jgi:hypothetical protein
MPLSGQSGKAVRREAVRREAVRREHRLVR